MDVERGSGERAPITLKPEGIALAAWREIYAGAAVRLDAACGERIDAGARALEAILAEGAPVYGVNTGFGKLAGIRVAAPSAWRG